MTVSFVVTSTLQTAISTHNAHLLQEHRKEKQQANKPCNCQQKQLCPLNGQCLTECIVYKATVTQTKTNKQETYIGLTANTFKTRYYGHKCSFKLKHKRSETTLSNHIWKLNESNADHKIDWEIVKRSKPYTPGKNICSLCLEEKFYILSRQPTLNHRKEIFAHCKHKKQFLLTNAVTSLSQATAF